VTPAQESSIERIGGALTQAGLARLPSRVFAALLVDDDGRMTSIELASALAVSPAGVSGAVGYLEQLGMLRRERERGSRRDVYVVDDDAWHDAMMRHDQLYGPIKASLTREFLVFLEDEFEALGEKWEKRKAELGY
jgi:DNA-binding transcriptional regulator GbsR (MarR family)